MDTTPYLLSLYPVLHSVTQWIGGLQDSPGDWRYRMRNDSLPTNLSGNHSRLKWLWNQKVFKFYWKSLVISDLAKRKAKPHGKTCWKLDEVPTKEPPRKTHQRYQWLLSIYLNRTMDWEHKKCPIGSDNQEVPLVEAGACDLMHIYHIGLQTLQVAEYLKDSSTISK